MGLISGQRLRVKGKAKIEAFSYYRVNNLMRTREEMLKIDRTAIKVTSIKEIESDDNECWQSRPPEERLVALELLRQIAYGYEPNTCRLQRVLEVAERK
jgi:hypothetical protein